MKPNAKAPRYLNLLRIHMPVTAVLSIGHRISGALLAAAVPLSIYLLDLSLRSPAGYARVAQLFASPAARFAVSLAVWALAHHALAGMRYLLLDLQVGIARPAARRGAQLVNLGGIVIFLLAAGALL